MGVYIKGIEPPDVWEGGRLIIYGVNLGENGGTGYEQEYRFSGADMTYVETPHGNLKDNTEIYHKLFPYLCESKRVEKAIEIMALADTIIEAED